jgi:hypothetical protein
MTYFTPSAKKFKAIGAYIAFSVQYDSVHILNLFFIFIKTFTTHNVITMFALDYVITMPFTAYIIITHNARKMFYFIIFSLFTHFLQYIIVKIAVQTNQCLTIITFFLCYDTF